MGKSAHAHVTSIDDIDAKNLKTENGIVLVPQPTDDPKDPLNWSALRKNITFAIISFNAFVSLVSAFSFTSGLVVEAKVFHVTSQQMSYAVSANLAGLIAGPIVQTPLAKILGINATLFWSTFILMLMTVWSAEMSGRDDYKGFVTSRAFVSFFATIPHVLGNGIIVNIFYLHQRGKAFSFYAFCFLFGGIVGQSLGGYIIQHTKWTWQMWYTLFPQGLALILIFFFVEDTTWNRNGLENKSARRSWLGARLATVTPGTENWPRPPWGEIWRFAYAPFLIVFSPVTVIGGLFSAVYFGFFAMVANLISIFLEQPWAPKKGMHGYGFDFQTTSLFTLSIWIGCIAAQLWGMLLNDRLPLWISKRRNQWHPEYRLHTLWFPAMIAMPVGLGLFGAGLQHHLHYMVLALGAFLITFGAFAAQPVALNYVVECFERNPQEVGTCLNAWRLALGLAIPFFLQQWEKSVGVGWVFGMAAFFSLFAWMLVAATFVIGKRLRGASIGNTGAAVEDDLSGKGIALQVR
ncbi:MAG: hypothetical protein Q9162_007225 [Coniocarpon cinnabarinum]